MKHFMILIFMLSLVGLNADSMKIAVVISSSSSQTASQDDVKAFFSGSKINWESGEVVILINQPNTDIESSMYNEFVGMSVSKSRQTLLKKVLSGQIPKPFVAKTDAQVISHLVANDNAIGYISATSVTKDVKVLFEISL